MDAFDTPGTDEILVPPPLPWDLDSIPCHGELEEQTPLVWRTLGEPPLCGVALPTQEDRGEGWIAQRAIIVPDTPTAEQIASFTVRMQGLAALVEWETANEMDVLGFNLICDGIQTNEDLISAQTPGSPLGARYALAGQQPGNQYWLEIVEADGHTTRHGPAAVRYVLYFPVSFLNPTLP